MYPRRLCEAAAQQVVLINTSTPPLMSLRQTVYRICQAFVYLLFTCRVTKSLLCSVLAPHLQTRRRHREWIIRGLFLPWGERAPPPKEVTQHINNRFSLMQSDDDLSSNGRVSLSPRGSNWFQMAKKNKHWCTSACLKESPSMKSSVSHVFMSNDNTSSFPT